MSSYRDAAVTLWGEAGAYSYDSYTQWLALFPELPDELPIVIGLTRSCIGLIRTHWQHGPRITVFSGLFSRGRHLVDDTMAHEMLHAALYLTGRWTGPQDGPSHGHAWYTAIRKLSPAVLGHDLDISSAEDTISHGGVARWPQSFRPKHWPVGSPIDCPTY